MLTPSHWKMIRHWGVVLIALIAADAWAVYWCLSAYDQYQAAERLFPQLGRYGVSDADFRITSDRIGAGLHRAKQAYAISAVGILVAFGLVTHIVRSGVLPWLRSRTRRSYPVILGS